MDVSLLSFIVAEAICLAIAAYGWIWVRRWNAYRRWPTVSGRVLRVGLAELDEDNEGTLFRPTVQYQYAVQGRTYQSSAIKPMKTQELRYSAKSWARSRVRKYAVGRPVTVYYDPANPAKACLEPWSAGPYVALVSGLLWSVLLVFIYAAE